MTETDTAPEPDDGYAQWHERHQRGSAAVLADARQQLQAALGQIIAARAELDAAEHYWRDCDGECTACIGPTARQDIEAFIADAERMLRAAQALTDAPPDPPTRTENDMTQLILERKDQPNETPDFGGLMFTPPVGEDYWEYRVRVTDGQAIVGFPKFFTVGIGFAVEEDWNTNLPYTCTAEKIYEHIEHNRGDESITREDCIAAIRMIQEAAAADRAR